MTARQLYNTFTATTVSVTYFQFLFNWPISPENTPG